MDRVLVSWWREVSEEEEEEDEEGEGKEQWLVAEFAEDNLVLSQDGVDECFLRRLHRSVGGRVRRRFDFRRF